MTDGATQTTVANDDSGLDPSGFEILARMLEEKKRTAKFGSFERWKADASELLERIRASGGDAQAARDAERVVKAYDAVELLLRASVGEKAKRTRHLTFRP